MGPGKDAGYGFAFLLSEEQVVSGTENGITLSSWKIVGSVGYLIKWWGSGTLPWSIEAADVAALFREETIVNVVFRAWKQSISALVTCWLDSRRCGQDIVEQCLEIILGVSFYSKVLCLVICSLALFLDHLLNCRTLGWNLANLGCWSSMSNVERTWGEAELF